MVGWTGPPHKTFTEVFRQGFPYKSWLYAEMGQWLTPPDFDGPAHRNGLGYNGRTRSSEAKYTHVIRMLMHAPVRIRLSAQIFRTHRGIILYKIRCVDWKEEGSNKLLDRPGWNAYSPCLSRKVWKTWSCARREAGDVGSNPTTLTN